MSAKYVLEYFNGAYLPIDSLEELDEWRKENPLYEGILYTHDGYLVDEQKLRQSGAQS